LFIRPTEKGKVGKGGNEGVGTGEEEEGKERRRDVTAVFH